VQILERFLGKQVRRILWKVPMKVFSPIGDYKPINVLTMEENRTKCFLKPKPIVLSYLSMFQNFISKL